MFPLPHPLTADGLSGFQSLAAQLDDARPHPDEAALQHLGRAVLTEVLDLFADTALEDVQGLVAETVIGAFHSAAQRIDRDADRARDTIRALLRDFDGSEVMDADLQAATQTARAADVAVLALELVRDAAAATYATATGDSWRPWTGSVRASRTTAAQIDARDALKARDQARRQAADPSDCVVAFRGAPGADTAEDAGRIFDALNWAQATWPDMALATSGAKGAERLAIRWAQQKRVNLVLARVDFDRHGRAAPFRVNDTLMALDPVCVLTLARSLDAARAAQAQPFGPALNLAQKARGAAVRAVRITAKAAPA